MARRNQRSAEATEYRRLYKTARWRARRAKQLSAEPLCRTCALHGRTTAATVADHVIPHRGDEKLFWDGDLQSLCDVDPFRCHSRIKQREERLGFSPAVGADGYPLDPNHRAHEYCASTPPPGIKSSPRTSVKDRRGPIKLTTA